ncbi:MAG: CDP-6-deoxy-D-xylo-4-hexulose-3-dehydrase [Parcubacteria group bacterium Gr01-1014_70]|nr:MAG: CDP-6-deoxy-D-xylo-4-hexulose-3-dehydrase [Parcubacteria group bacterium Gr01-1014_70]
METVPNDTDAVKFSALIRNDIVAYMQRRYNLAERIIDNRDLAALSLWLKKNPRLTQGELTKKLEQQWAEWIGTKYAVFCNSGSSANLLAAYALLMSNTLRNKKVIVPSVGWATTIAPFIQLGFEPIMCGADQNTFALDAAHLEELLKQHNAATVVLVQVLGVPANMDLLLRLKKTYNFLLVEDACAALGARYGVKKVGAFGDLSTFSFYFGHQLSTIEGGIVNTNDKELHDILLMLRSHGWGKDLEKKARVRLMKTHTIDEWHEPFTFFVPGFNVRSTDLNAFLGLRQMRKADSVSGIRMRNHAIYAAHVKNVDFQKWDTKAVPCSISFGALAKTPAHRKRIVETLDEHHIETRLFSAGNLGLHPFWYERYGTFSHPVSDRVHSCGFFLPNNESLTKKDVLYICDVVNKVQP